MINQQKIILNNKTYSPENLLTILHEKLQLLKKDIINNSDEIYTNDDENDDENDDVNDDDVKDDDDDNNNDYFPEEVQQAFDILKEYSNKLIKESSIII
eukprot:Pgem_evm1s7775